jgi:hypothetical protein
LKLPPPVKKTWPVGNPETSEALNPKPVFGPAATAALAPSETTKSAADAAISMERIDLILPPSGRRQPAFLG